MEDESNMEEDAPSGLVTLEIHHGGLLHTGHKWRYVGGAKSNLIVNMSRALCYDDVASMINETTSNVAQLYYRESLYGASIGALRVLACQQDLLDMIQSLERRVLDTRFVDIYVQHIDGYESDAASLEHMDEDDYDDELFAIRSKRLEEKNKKGKRVSEDDPNQEDGATDLPGVDDDYRNADEEYYMETQNWPNEVEEREESYMDHLGWQTLIHRDTLEDDEESDGIHSEYPDSDEYDSPTMDSDEEGLRRIAPFFEVFNPTLDPFKYEPVLGMKFKDPKQLKDVLRYYAVEKKHAIRFERSKKKLVLAKCKPKCTWRLYASWMKSEDSFQIKSLKEEHKCSKSYRIGIANSRWIAKVFHNKIINNLRVLHRAEFPTVVPLPRTLTGTSMPQSGTSMNASRLLHRAELPTVRKTQLQGTSPKPPNGPINKRTSQPKGVGLYICPQTGDSFFKAPGAKRGRWSSKSGGSNKAFVPHKCANQTPMQPPMRYGIMQNPRPTLMKAVTNTQPSVEATQPPPRMKATRQPPPTTKPQQPATQPPPQSSILKKTTTKPQQPATQPPPQSSILKKTFIWDN